MSEFGQVKEWIPSSMIETTTNLISQKWCSFSNKLAYNLFYNTQFARPELITFATFITISLTLAVVGSYATVEKPKNALNPLRAHPLFDPTDLDAQSDEDTTMDGKSAATMPVIGGVALCCLYYGIKNISKETLMYYLKNYVVLLSVVSNFQTADYLIRVSARQLSYWLNIRFLKYFRFTMADDGGEYHPFGIELNFFMDDSTSTLRIIKEEMLNESRSDVTVRKQLFNFFFSTSQLISLPAALGLTTAFHRMEEDWILSNIVACSFTIFGIRSLHINNIKTGIILLTGLFFYDIYFVFGTEIMVTVATGIDLPLKFMIPKAGLEIIEGGKLPMSILGLGDIVIPTVFISFALRYDLWKFHDQNEGYEFHHLQRYPKPMFIASMVGYVLGLSITMAVLEIFKQGQPALLYIVPSIFFTVFSTAIFRGDLKTLWNYNELPDESDIAFVSNSVSEGTLRLLQLDDADDDSDEEYIYNEDTVLIMDEYLDYVDSEIDSDQEKSATEIDDDEDDDEDDMVTFVKDESEPSLSTQFLVAEINSDEDGYNSEDDLDYDFNE